MEERVVLVLLIALNSAWSASPPCQVNYYRELGCEPMTNDDNGCPSYYKCPDLHPEPTMCYYKGVSYKSNEYIPDDAVKNPCSVACYCDVSNTTVSTVSTDNPEAKEAANATTIELQTTFQCAAVDCVEDFTSDVEEECVPTYSLDSCCSSGKVCGKEEINKLTTCEVDSKTYRQGQQFYPANTCQVCLCTPQFNGSFEGMPYCRDIDCGIEIHNQMELAERCAPVVMSGSSCCPHKWECPDNSTSLIRATNYTLRDEGVSCQFGDTTLRVGDQLSVSDKCIQCECRVPPFVSCVQLQGCQN